MKQTSSWYADLMREDPIVLIKRAVRQVSAPVSRARQQQLFLLAYDCRQKASQLSDMARERTAEASDEDKFERLLADRPTTTTAEAALCDQLADELDGWADVLIARFRRATLPPDLLLKVVDGVAMFADPLADSAGDIAAAMDSERADIVKRLRGRIDNGTRRRPAAGTEFKDYKIRL